MKTQEFDFQYPKDLIATVAKPRGESRILHISRSEKSFREIGFEDLIKLFKPHDALILNNSKVLWARLEAHKATGAKLEVFFLKSLDPIHWEILIKGSVKKGGLILLPGDEKAVVSEHRGRTVVLEWPHAVDTTAYLTQWGQVPLPPYIVQSREALHQDVQNQEDKTRYQTIWAKEMGSVAAPTAGLHFTEEHLQKIKNRGARISEVTLHVGAGTFLPLDTENLEDFKMHAEDLEVSPVAVQAIREGKKSNGKIWACGTTALRALETAALHRQNEEEVLVPFEGETKIFITPGHQFRVVDALLTNFHQPQSTLLALAVAFVGEKELLMEAYQFAIRERFRLFSYGDLTVIT